MKRRVSVDFDGVLNNYQGYDSNLGEPKPFVKQFLKRLHDEYELIVFTCRESNEVTQWLIAHGLIDYVDEITDKKTPSIAYIDDRAIQFNGNFNRTLEELEFFKPYWDKKTKATFKGVDSFEEYVQKIKQDIEEHPLATIKELDEKIETLKEIKNNKIIELFDAGKISIFDYSPARTYDDDFDLEEED